MADMIFKTGEFAKLCGVSKDTLIYYDRISLLKPAVIKENGYRYYSVHQLFSFDLIEALKEVGTPLSQIKDYIQKRDSALFKDILSQKLCDLEKELKRLEMMKRTVKNTISSMGLAQSINRNKIVFKELPEEYLITTKNAEYLSDSVTDYYKVFREHIDYCYENGYSESFMIGSIVLYDDIVNGIFEEHCLFSQIYHCAESKRLHIKPAGLYAVMYFYGSYDDLNEAYRFLAKFAEDSGYLIAGNMYEKDILNYMCVDDENSYLMEISVPIKSKT